MKRVITVLVGIGLVISTIPMMGAAMSTQADTELLVTPSVETVEVGETVEYQVILQSASNGVGAYRLSASLSDPAVGTITDVAFGGEPELTEINYSENGAQVEVRAALADITESEQVLVATVTVEVVDPGATTMELSDAVVGDKTGFGYDITQRTTN